MTPYLYPLLFSAAVLIGMVVTEVLSVDRATSRKMYLSGIVGGILGARAWYALQYGQLLDPGGFSLYGFGLGAAIGAAAYHRLHNGGWTPTEFPDAAAPAFALGLAIQRVGCFFAGCCYGSRCDLPWAVTYGPGKPVFQKQVGFGLISPQASASLPVHPTQLYSSLAALIVFGVLIWLLKKWTGRRRYDLILLAIVACGVLRFFNEFIRDDAGGLHFGWLTFAQATSLMLTLPALTLLILRHRGALL